MSFSKFAGNTLLAITTVVAFASKAHAVKFTNQFVEFELPVKWQCSLEGAEWVCQSTDETRKRDAIIVLAAKLKGDQDSLDKYQEYLGKPRVFNAPSGKSVTSDPKYASVKQFNGHPWVDSLHLESEIPGFYTRYLATVKEDIGVLVTYSINKTKYTDYQAQFEDLVKSIKVFRSKTINANSLAGPNSNLFNTQSLPGQVAALSEGLKAPDAQTGDSKPASGGGDDNMMLYGLAALAVVGFIIYKKKKAAGGGS